MQASNSTQANRRDLSNHALFIFTHPFLSSAFILTVAFVSLAAQRGLDWDPSYLNSVLAFSIIGVCMPLVAGFLYRKTWSMYPTIEHIVDAPSEQIAKWFQQQIASIFGSRWIFVVAVAAALAGIMTTEQVGIPWSGIPRDLYLIFSGVFFAATGAVAWAYLNLLAFLSRLGNLEIRGAPFEWPQKEFGSLNAVYLQMFAAGVALYIGTVIAVWISPSGQWIALYNPLIELWILPVAAMVIGFFLAEQYLIHRIIAHSKQRRLDVMDGMLRSMFNEWTTAFSTDKAAAITDLLNWQDHIRKEMDWPLDLTSMLAIIVGLLLPTIKTVLELVAQK